MERKEKSVQSSVSGASITCLEQFWEGAESAAARCAATQFSSKFRKDGKMNEFFRLY
jgi:hypothetical protein